MLVEKRVLVVEDDPSVYPLIRGMILKLNPKSNIDFADSAEKAAELLLGASSRRYDVILSDLNLAGQKNGVDLVKEVYFKTGRTPFILASTDAEFVTHLPYILKPFRFDDFAERMGPYLLPGNSGRKLSRKTMLAIGLVVALGLAAFIFLRAT